MSWSFAPCCHNNPIKKKRGNQTEPSIVIADWEREQQQQERDVWRLQLSCDSSQIAQAWLQDMAFWELEREPSSHIVSSSTTNNATSNSSMGNSQHGHHDHPQNNNKNKATETGGAFNSHVIGSSNGIQHPIPQQQTLEHRHSSAGSDAASRALQRRSSTESMNSKGRSSKNRTMSVGDDEDEFEKLQQQRLMEYYQETGQVPPQQQGHRVITAVATTTATTTHQAPPPVWKSTVDPNTGRTYYYDLVTRRTQWEKVSHMQMMKRKIISFAFSPLTTLLLLFSCVLLIV
jgi:hypothetical protein